MYYWCYIYCFFVYIHTVHTHYPHSFLCKKNVFCLVFDVHLRVFHRSERCRPLMPPRNSMSAWDPWRTFHKTQQVFWVKNPTPGDSKWPFHPPVGGHLTIQKGHLTIPKRAQRIARPFFLCCPFFFGGGKTGGKGRKQLIGKSWEKLCGSINEGFCGFHSVKYHSWTWTSSETTIFYALMWFRTQAHAKVDMSRITHDRSMGLVYLPTSTLQWAV